MDAASPPEKKIFYFPNGLVFLVIIMPVTIQFPMAQQTEQPAAVAQQERLEQVLGCLLGTAVATNTVVEAGWRSLGCRAHTLAPAELELRALVVVKT